MHLTADTGLSGLFVLFVRSSKETCPAWHFLHSVWPSSFWNWPKTQPRQVGVFAPAAPPVNVMGMYPPISAKRPAGHAKHAAWSSVSSVSHVFRPVISPSGQFSQPFGFELLTSVATGQRLHGSMSAS